MNNYCVYVLLNESNVVYIGITNDISRRISQHKSLNKIKFDNYRIMISNCSEIYAKLIESLLIEFGTIVLMLKLENKDFNKDYFVWQLQKEMAVDQEKNNNFNKEKKREENIIINIHAQFVSQFNSITQKAFRGNAKTQSQLKARLNEKYTLEQILLATKNCFADPYHKENPKYLTPEFILRADKLEKYLNIKMVDQPIEEKREAPKKDFFKVDYNPNA